MVDLSKKYLMMIEPQKGKEFSIYDELTTKSYVLNFKLKRSDYQYKGFHICKCGEVSDSYDWILPNGMITNSLFMHYITYHRSEIPESEVEKLEKLFEEYDIVC